MVSSSDYKGMSNQRKSRKNKELPQQGSSIRPEHFPVGSAQSRAAARALLSQNQKRIQLIFHCAELPLNLETSRCVRNACPDGTILEVVELDGNADELAKDELEEFVLRHPIAYKNERNTGLQSEE